MLPIPTLMESQDMHGRQPTIPEVNEESAARHSLPREFEKVTKEQEDTRTLPTQSRFFTSNNVSSRILSAGHQLP